MFQVNYGKYSESSGDTLVRFACAFSDSNGVQFHYTYPTMKNRIATSSRSSHRMPRMFSKMQINTIIQLQCLSSIFDHEECRAPKTLLSRSSSQPFETIMKSFTAIWHNHTHAHNFILFDYKKYIYLDGHESRH